MHLHMFSQLIHPKAASDDPPRVFYFDHAVPPQHSTKMLFDTAVMPIVDSVLNGSVACPRLRHATPSGIACHGGISRRTVGGSAPTWPAATTAP
jgi:hypothetical protein